MAFRGRGRGRGRGGFGSGPRAKEEKYELYPEIKELPEVNLKQKEELRALVSWSNDLQKFWISSPYHYEGIGEESEKIIGKPPLSDYMRMTDDYVPAELGVRNARHSNKKVRWDPQSDLKRLDFFEKLDQRPQGQDEDDNERKEDEDEEENIEDEEDEEEGVADDYEQNRDFDDDEDDFNLADDGGNDEGYY